MNYYSILYNDTGNAKGISTVLFVSGCSHHCPECHNKQTWDSNAGYPFSEWKKEEILESLKKPYIKNFVISGGDPLYKDNIEEIMFLCQEIRDNKIEINIILYTGYTWQEIQANMTKNHNLFKLCSYLDWIIDGRYMPEYATKIRDFRGSKNQRAYNIIRSYDEELFIVVDKSDEYFKEETICMR